MNEKAQLQIYALSNLIQINGEWYRIDLAHPAKCLNQNTQNPSLVPVANKVITRLLK